MIIGYARVSTDDQSQDSQTDALSAAGAEKVFADKISGSRRARPELDRMLEQLRDGDVVTVTKYDRMARSLKDLLEIVEAIRERGAGFRSPIIRQIHCCINAQSSHQAPIPRERFRPCPHGRPPLFQLNNCLSWPKRCEADQRLTGCIILHVQVGQRPRKS